MIRLSARLDRIFSFVPSGAAVCDVGTDHGYLPAALIASGRASRVIATDLRPQPLESARKNLEQFGIDTVDLRLCDGLAAVSPEEVDTVVIAGLGGEVIAGIIDRTPWLRSERMTLLFQPTTSAEALRIYLAENGFRIAEEYPLEENGKVYSVLSVRYTGERVILTAAQTFAGNITPETEAGKRYLEKQYRRCRECAESLMEAKPNAPQTQYYHAAAQDLFARLSGEKHGI